MKDLIGETFSHYRIIEELGRGGMGVVYKAEDLKLTRTVALKFLPHGLGANEPERARFLQEARAAAILNHPNICTIHDIQEEDGQQFIVMEYIEGTTLKLRIGDRGLRIEEAVNYAIQIAEALQEAHTHGIVHRDIKAENIMVNSKNQIKVMDFGLAKLKGSVKITRTSSTIGTLAYMAPEQIQGGEVDARSDIFSFGIVLYEMLTGHLPFRGEHEAAMVYSIVNEEPSPIQKDLPDAPSELVHVLGRMLEKDPEDRYQTAHDMLIDLRRLRKQTSKVSRVVPTPEQAIKLGEAAVESPQAPLHRPLWRSKRRVLWTSAAAVAVLAGTYFLLVPRSTLPKLNPLMSTRALEVPFAEMGYPTLSSDGKWIAFSAADTKGTWDFYFMNTTSPEVRRVTFDSSRFLNSSITISPDGGRIAYGRLLQDRLKSEICVASPLTGERRRLVDTAFGPMWRSDGERIGYMRWSESGPFSSRSGKPEFWSIRPDGTDKRLEFADTASKLTGTICYAWSPDLKSVAFISTRVGNSQEVYVRNLRDGSERQLTHLNSAMDNVRWAMNGWILFSSNKSGTTNLWMVSPEGGEPIEFTKGTSPYLDVSMSNDCKTFLAYQRVQVNRIWVAGLDGSGAGPVTSDEKLFLTPSFSSDGRQIVFSMSSGDPLSRVMYIYLMDRDGQRRRMITSGGTLRRPLCSPDGRWIAYAEYAEETYTGWMHGPSRCCVVDVTNPGDVRIVGNGSPLHWVDNQSFFSYRLSPPGSWLTYVDGREQQKVSPDSTVAVLLQASKQVLVYDLRSSKEGLYIGPAGSREQPFPQKVRLVRQFRPSGLDWNISVSPGGTFVLLYNKKLEFWRIALPSCTEKRIDKAFPEFNYGTPVSISDDGKFIVYEGPWQTKSRTVLMENPFQ